MSKLRLFGIGVAILAALSTVGAAVAVVQDGGPTTVHEADVTAVLAEGPAPSGGTYRVSSLDTDAPSTSYCYEIATDAVRGQGCMPSPSEGDTAPTPRKTNLGTDRFASSLVPSGIYSLRVRGPGDQIIAESRPGVAIEAVGRLLVATWGGPAGDV